MKSQQLYSIESVKLSSDGTYADITIAGDASVAETRFLSAGLRYGCTINHDGDVAYLEFELPEFLSDLTVTAVNLDEGKISVVGSGRYYAAWYDLGDFEIGDLYDGNLGSLVGRHVNMNVNSDRQVKDFFVQDEDVVIGAMEYKRDSATDPQNKYYFKDLLTDKKYYYSTTDTTSTNTTQFISAVDGDQAAETLAKYDYVKLVLNPNGTVASAVLEQALPNTIVCTANDEGKITQDVEKAVDLSSYTVEKDGAYIDPEDIEEGDVIFYNTTDKFADIFNYEVSGTIGTVYSNKVDIDDTTYDWVDYNDHIAQRFDAANLKYVDVTEKWLISLDDEETTTLSLNRRKQAVFVDGTETGVTVTADTDYVVVKASQAYADKGAAYINLFVSDGSSYSTIPVKVSGLSKWKGNDIELTIANEENGGTAAITDARSTELHGKTVAQMAGLITAKSLITITTKVSDDSITGIAFKNTAPMTGSSGGTQDKSLEPADTSVKTAAGSYTLLDDTKIWVLNPGTSGREVNVALKDFDDYANTTIAGNTEMAKVGIFASTTNKTAVDSVVIDNSGNDVIKGGNVATRVNGIIVGYETGLNVDDQATYELKKLTVWVPSANGGEKVTYTATDFANQIKKLNDQTLDADTSDDTNTFDTISQLAFDADGQLLFVSTDTDGVADNQPVTADLDTDELADSNSASTLKTATETLKLADSALVLEKKGAKNYAVTTISDINLKEDVTKTVTWHKALGTAADQVVDVLYVTYTANTVAPVVTSDITIKTGHIAMSADDTISTAETTLSADFTGTGEIESVQWYMNGIAGSGTTAKQADVTLTDLGTVADGKTVYVKFVDSEGNTYVSDTYKFEDPEIDTITVSNNGGAATAVTTSTLDTIATPKYKINGSTLLLSGDGGAPDEADEYTFTVIDQFGEEMTSGWTAYVAKSGGAPAQASTTASAALDADSTYTIMFYTGADNTGEDFDTIVSVKTPA